MSGSGFPSKLFSAALTVIVLGLSQGCGDDDPSGPGTWNNGAWTGQTASGIQVTFTLDHPDVSDWTMTVTHQYADTTDTRTWTSPQLEVASDSSMSWSDSVYSDSLQYSFSMSGTFASGDSVFGEWDSVVYYQMGGGSGTDELGGSWWATGP